MLTIIHQDDDLLAVDKLSGLLSVPGRGPDKQDCCLSRVTAQFPEALMVHRLDMDTSGLLLFARSPEVQKAISLQFEKREIHKSYLAIVEGQLEPNEGSVNFSMRKDMTQRLPPKHLVDCVRGKKALTNWRVIEQATDSSRVALFPETGRSHQLRVHMSALGHPIVGDNIYGTAGERLMLHAHKLKLNHPITGEPLHLEAQPPF